MRNKWLKRHDGTVWFYIIKWIATLQYVANIELADNNYNITCDMSVVQCLVKGLLLTWTPVKKYISEKVFLN
jgi:hypothetical protein